MKSEYLIWTGLIVWATLGTALALADGAPVQRAFRPMWAWLARALRLAAICATMWFSGRSSTQGPMR